MSYNMEKVTETVVIVGASSEIAGRIAINLACNRDFVLLARQSERLTTRGGLVSVLKELGARSVEVREFNATDFTSIRPIISHIPRIDHAVVSFGTLGDQNKAESDEAHAAEIATIDYTAQIVALTVLADIMKRQTHTTTITVFSSIAGWRPRRANYVYGSAKAGLDAFSQGLADSLHGSSVKMIIARPGFVIGHMTRGMKPAPMSVTPNIVAEAICSAITRSTKEKSTSTTLWIPSKLAILATIMKLVPRRIWRKMPR
ncbi:SDR family oxidoreductase [Corynebacterium diphtheriae]|uniref:SDR family oxidoreductase n=1 Tax=Corynebacterium diphtheriae TaxID=1717 RepID=UPI0002467DF1|nr:SDR family oxidoreductase [Corynebacterium diphtheriae]AEX76637.1 hypothetical protein CDHC02_1145 [Corynebacterium diphtheriae HC02]